MVVAAGAREGGAEEGRRGRTDHVVQFVGALVGGQHGVGRFHPVPRTAHEEAGSGVGSELVPGQLLADEAVVGQVGVEGLDDVIAVGPGVGTRQIGLEAVGLREAGDVEPVPRPFLAETGRGQQAVDHRVVSSIRGVGDKGGDFLRRWRQSDDVEVGASDERAGVCGLGETEALGFECRVDEVVDLRALGGPSDWLV